MFMNKKSKYYPCCECNLQPYCADNEWCLYDPYNKKCPNFLEGVKQHHKFMKQYKKEIKRGY